jgi:hypothetical protein
MPITYSLTRPSYKEKRSISTQKDQWRGLALQIHLDITKLLKHPLYRPVNEQTTLDEAYEELKSLSPQED